MVYYQCEIPLAMICVITFGAIDPFYRKPKRYFDFILEHLIHLDIRGD